MMDRAEALLAQSFRQKTGPGELAIPTIRGVDGSLIHMLDHKTDLGQVWEMEFNPAGLVESKVLRSPDRSVQIALNGPSARRTQSNRVIEEYFGAGVQHLAFEATDIFAAADQRDLL